MGKNNGVEVQTTSDTAPCNKCGTTHAKMTPEQAKLAARTIRAVFEGLGIMEKVKAVTFELVDGGDVVMRVAGRIPEDDQEHYD